MTEMKLVSIVVKRRRPTRSTVHVTKLVLIPLNSSTQKNIGRKHIQKVFLACLRQLFLLAKNTIETKTLNCLISKI